MQVVVTGANRGIGLGLVELFLAAGHQVRATARDVGRADALAALGRAHPGRLDLDPLDVGDEAQVAAWGRALVGPVDLLINNAGVSGPPTPRALDCDFAAGHQVMDTNAFGPLRVARAIYPSLRRPGAKVVNISSLMGSIADNQAGGSYFYRMSKSALNMAVRCLAHEWLPAGVVAVAVHPGWVRTRMGGAQAPVSVEDSCAGIARVAAGLQMADSGRFLGHDGRPLAW